ncbi:MAG: acyl carrier protein [Thermodesulfovibrionales bacterium]|nr:acyl carrier protein [Thermodesulfovibrionales bacterium]
MSNLVKEIMSDVLNRTIDENAAMSTIGLWDSLKHMEIISALEDNFEIQFKADEIVTMTSYQAICEILKKYGKI